ncbi:RimK family alpha-L-glutamate ligase [Candidatus Gracilibacteria bacterium]|nr:RimK family alpha-L-glutamate ligase [Candidatus Gracilibacteria bacterium]
MKIYVLTNQKSTKMHSTLRIKEEAKKLGITLRVLVPEKFELVIGADGSEHIFYNEKPIAHPDVLIPRHDTTYFTHMITRHFEKSNTFVVNTARARKIAKDKLLALQYLAQNNIPVPKSILAKFPLNINFIEKHLSYPMIVKKSEGSHGKGIMLSENRGQLEDLLEMMADSLATKNTNIILQEFISERKGKDIRVIVIGGRAIGAMLRTGKDGDFKANFSGGGSVEKFELTPEIEWLAIESAKILGLDIAGVDILFDKDGYKICEVNASPQFEGFEQATGINLPAALFHYLSARLGE